MLAMRRVRDRVLRGVGRVNVIHVRIQFSVVLLKVVAQSLREVCGRVCACLDRLR